MNKKPDPEMIDEDNPEWTEEMFRTALRFHELPVGLQKKLRGVRGPQKKPVKVQTAIRFDADVIEALRATGKGWQTRVNDVMREWVSKNAV